MCCGSVGEFTVKELSVWLVVDVGDSQGRQLISGALSYIVRKLGT